MIINRKIEMLIATKESYIIRKSSSDARTVCAKCGEPTLTAQQTAGIFGITQRRIFRLIEAGAAHFTETETGAVMICLSSLATVLDQKS
jgi:hypothetical protein